MSGDKVCHRCGEGMKKMTTIQCDPEAKSNCTDKEFCCGFYLSEYCYCGMMNRKAKSINEFIDDVLNEVHNACASGENPTWVDLCVEIPVPEAISTGAELVIWGEEEENEDLFFSVQIYWDERRYSFGYLTFSNSDRDLTDTLKETLYRLIYETRKENCDV